MAEATRQVQAVYDKLSLSAGPICDALDQAAEALAQGKQSPLEVKQHALERVRKAVRETFSRTARTLSERSGSASESGSGVHGATPQEVREVAGEPGEGALGERPGEPEDVDEHTAFAQNLDRPMTPDGQQQGTGWTSVEPTYSLDQVYRNAAWEKLPDRQNHPGGLNRRPARLRLNLQALDMLGNAIGKSYRGASSRASGLLARELRQHLDQLYADGKIGGEAHGNGRALAKVLVSLHGVPAIQYRSDSGLTLRKRADILREELAHYLQSILGGGTAFGHIYAETMTRHPLWPIVRRALLRTYKGNDDVLVAEAGAKLVAGLWQELDLPRRDGIRLLAYYFRNLEAAHGTEDARKVVAFADRITRRELDDELKTVAPLPDQQGGRRVSGPADEGEGGGHAFSNSFRRVEGGRRGSPGEKVRRDVSPGEPTLFDAPTNEAVASDAARDRDQLEGERLTAQLNAPLTREEQLKKLKRSKDKPQQSRSASSPTASLFSESIGTAFIATSASPPTRRLIRTI